MSIPRIIRIEAKDVQLTMEVSLNFMVKLEKFLSMSELNFDSTKPEEKEIAEFATEELYPFVKGTIEGIGNGPASNFE